MATQKQKSTTKRNSCSRCGGGRCTNSKCARKTCRKSTTCANKNAFLKEGKTTIAIIIILAVLLAASLVIILVLMLNKPKESNPDTPSQPAEIDYSYRNGGMKFNLETIEQLETQLSYEERIQRGYAGPFLISTEQDYRNMLAENKDIFTDTILAKIGAEPSNFDTTSYIFFMEFDDDCGATYSVPSVQNENNTAVIHFDIQEHCGGCMSTDNLYIISIDNKAIDATELVRHVYEGSPCDPDVALKPLLYLYPEEETNVAVSFARPENLTTTYPKYADLWKVTAKPNGDLSMNGGYYYGLYWEENAIHDYDKNTGFFVTKNNAISFLEEKISYLGLNDRERNEFIMYWLPILEQNEKSVVRFMLTEELQNLNALNITPKPDSLLRIRMLVEKVDANPNLPEPTLPSFERKGFTAVEWGGVNL